MSRIRPRLQGMQEALVEVARQVDADLPTILRTFAELAVQDILPAWPVATGKSKGAIRVRRESGRTNIAVMVDYASYIRQRGADRPAYELLILDYIRANMDAIGRRTADRLRGA